MVGSGQGKTLVTKGKTLVTKRTTLVTKEKTLLGEGKTFLKDRKGKRLGAAQLAACRAEGKAADRPPFF